MTRSRPRTALLVLLATLVAVLAGLAGPAAAAAAPYCGITWGSSPKSQVTGDLDVVTDVRAGRHACYDRLVIDLSGQGDRFGAFDVRYVPAVKADGSGAVVPLRGGAALQVTVEAPAYDEHGNATYSPADRRELVDVGAFATFRQVAWAGSFEGRTTIGLGVRAKLPFRAFFLAGAPYSDQGPRLVIDVAHRW